MLTMTSWSKMAVVKSMIPRIPRIYVAGAAVRAALIIYGIWHDSQWAVKYTDIDYMVFTDAARFVCDGRSPYERATYRYTPILAFLLTPNIMIHPVCGKVLFAFADLLVGVLIERITEHSLRRFRESQSAHGSSLSPQTLACCWLFNPIVINVSTRGNAEALVSLAVLSTLFVLQRGHIFLGGVLLAVSVHLKIYPIIYALPLMVSIPVQQVSGNGSSLVRNIKQLFDGRRVSFIVTTCCYLSILTGGFCWMYGYTFLYESILYHIVRTDHRHNFSLYFYPLYLAQASGSGLALGIVAFVPQVVLSLGLTWRYAKEDIGTCLLLQTVAFVALNKVSTVQYWVWYFALLPISMPGWDRPRWVYAAWAAAVWVGAAASWLGVAYGLEMEGRAVWLQLMAASSCLVAAHVILFCFVAIHTRNPLLDAPAHAKQT